jgi:hypothetical protein
MAIHYVHIGKSGGTALKHAIREAGKAAIAGSDATFDKEVPWDSPLGPVHLHGHGFKLKHVPEGDVTFFSIRDPASRFVSSFYSRLRQGMPRYFRKWSEEEEQAFKWFKTPQELALGLGKRRGKKRAQAEFAMQAIRHIRRPLSLWLGDVEHLRKKLPQIAYIARQETLDEDWTRIKTMLELPADLELPSDPVQAHRAPEDLDRSLNPKMMDALMDWYAEDYKLVALCDEVRPELIARVERGHSRSDAV